MKTRIMKVFSITGAALFPLLLQAAPVEQLYCQFQNQEGRFILENNPDEAVAYVRLESDGLCALGSAYIDKMGKPKVSLAIYESCFVNKLAQASERNLKSPSIRSLQYTRPSDQKTFLLACEFEK